MRHHESITHLDILENDGPLLQITHIDSLQPRGGVPSNDIGRTDRHLCSVALFGESLDGLKGLHSLNERELLLTDGRRAIGPDRDTTIILYGVGRLNGWRSLGWRALHGLGHGEPYAKGTDQNG